MLKVNDLNKHFGGVQALLGIDFSLQENEILGVIGPNGAGKTTLFNALSGTLTVNSGKIFFRDKEITHFPPQKRSRMGIMRTFQNLSLYDDLTLQENVILGANAWYRPGLKDIFDLKSSKYTKTLPTAIDNLSLVGLEGQRHNYPDNLSYGNQRKLEIARALTGKPKLLLLDEPAAGLNNHESEELAELLLHIRDNFKLTILIIEHDMDVLMNISDRVLVLVEGGLLTVDTPSNIQKDKRVINAYLGSEI